MNKVIRPRKQHQVLGMLTAAAMTCAALACSANVESATGKKDSDSSIQQSSTTAMPSGVTAALPDLSPAKVQNEHYKTVVAEVQNLHPKQILHSNSPDEAIEKFQSNSMEGRAVFSTVNVEGMPFKKAIRIDTDKKPEEWMTHIQSFTKESIHKGDIIYVTAWTRLIRRTDGQALGVGRLYASEERGGNGKSSNNLFSGDFRIPSEWTRVHFGLRADRDHGAEDELKLMFTFGHTSQIVEFGGLTVINFGPNITKEQLPHTKLNLTYPGREANAAWRKAAQQRIEKYRKGDLRVVVTDASGKPIPMADVKVNMKRHAFYFGSTLPGGMLPKEYQQVKAINEDFKRTAGAPEEDKKRIQQEFLRLFNCSTNGLTWSTWGGADMRISQNDLKGTVRWFYDKDVPLFNAQAVYPSAEFTPPSVRPLIKAGKKEEFAKAVKDYVTLVATEFPGIRSIQIANEIEGRPDYTNVLGRDSVPDWFKWVKEANPQMGTEINGPYRLGEANVSTQNRGAAWPQSEGLQYYYDLISWLTTKGAPIDYIGFQNHSGIGAPGPEAVLKTLDQFATFGKPLEVTEFEITLQNGNDASQRQYQADYLRDYFIAVFSHPRVRMIMLQDFWQPAAWQYEAASAFFNKDWTMNPHGKVYEDLVLNKWWTRSKGQTNAQGVLTTRGFKGDYEITVNYKGKTKTVPARIDNKVGRVTITLP